MHNSGSDQIIYIRFYFGDYLEMSKHLYFDTRSNLSNIHFITYDDPVARRWANSKRPLADISDATGSLKDNDVEMMNVSAFGTKPGIGKTAVHLRCHEKHEYQKLMDEQKKELRDWHAKQGNGDMKLPAKKASMKKVKFNSTVATAVTKKLDEMKSEEAHEAEVKGYISSLLNEIVPGNASHTSGPNPATASATQAAPSILKSILRHTKNAHP